MVQSRGAMPPGIGPRGFSIFVFGFSGRENSRSVFFFVLGTKKGAGGFVKGVEGSLLQISVASPRIVSPAPSLRRRGSRSATPRPAHRDLARRGQHGRHAERRGRAPAGVLVDISPITPASADDYGHDDRRGDAGRRRRAGRGKHADRLRGQPEAGGAPHSNQLKVEVSIASGVTLAPRH